MYMVENSAVREEDENYCSPVDLLFDDLERVDPDHIALKEYKVFKQASGKTAKSILVSTAVRLAAFNLPEMARLTSRDDMQLGTLGDRKRVIFAVIPITMPRLTTWSVFYTGRHFRSCTMRQITNMGAGFRFRYES